ncbi:HD-GYP domain-containing protein [Clostridium cylindrosporum]|uniref:Cyclic di-GMP phosphodiesterase response regulator RpfG n=1 Tax=Clostridium cylindrosporum DSM 605 TaxID=1121307 RepID=A0A0J8D9L1_CLOCY|nr:HD-GYP domain-containing protein [Clostridium cylindrosporum]KMT22740.1 cyclic di-GMP phosphodiesterase response regulator RpfG [Clostridium cylindrosporum DSM 605]
MRLVRLSRVIPGEELAQSIISSEGNILLNAGVKLNERFIKRLEIMGLNYIYVKDSNLEDIEPEDSKFVQLKAEAIKSISNVFSKVQSSNNFKVKETINVVEDMVDYLTCNREITSIHLTELKTYDNYTFMHCLNSAVIGLYFGLEKGFTKNMLVDLGIGTILHDIGKMRIPHNILNKDGKLTDEEFQEMKRHPEYGYEILQKVDRISERAKSIVLQHHERIDGTGYPYAVKGDKISAYAKIACISDVYDALISDRVYRKGFPANEAYEIIMMNSGKLLDEELVKIFQKNFSMYPLGIEVMLNNGLKGFVIGHNKGFPDRPIVRLVTNGSGEKISPVEVDLLKYLNISITDIIA